jgi:putative transposase
MFYKQKLTSIEQLKKEIDEYIIYYNNEKIKFKQNEPDKISSSLLSKLIIKLS